MVGKEASYYEIIADYNAGTVLGRLSHFLMGQAKGGGISVRRQNC
jgi:hypothetical protein